MSVRYHRSRVSGVTSVAKSRRVWDPRILARSARRRRWPSVKSEAAAVQAELTQGDLLEVRGARLDHLQVYDHRRERAGFVRSASY